MSWVQFYKVDQDVIVSYVEGTGTRDLFPKILGYPSIPYKYVNGETFFGKEELESLEKKVSKNLAREADKAMDTLVKASDNFMEFSIKISRQDLSRRSLEKLAETFEDFVEALKGLAGLAALPLCFDPLVEKELEKEIAKIFPPGEKKQEYERTLRALVDLKGETFGVREKRELLEIAAEVQKVQKLKNLFSGNPPAKMKILLEDYPTIRKKIAKHANDWAWIKIHVMEGDPYKTEDFILRIAEYLEKDPKDELARLKKAKQKANKNFAQIVGQHPNLKELADCAQRIMLVRDYRFASVCKGAFYSRHLLWEIAMRFGLPYFDILYLLPSETVKGLETGNLDTKFVAERKKGYAFIVEGKSEKIFSGSELKMLLDREKNDFAGAHEFSGIPACKGFVRGQVRIVLGVRDLSKVKKGDVLVCQQTVPDFVPAMEKASAIVTDLGGITSHAAIISRELCMPCIVGTKIATKVLKDNDLVEVDADKGIVRKLK